MTQKALRVPDYLVHILQAIHRIERYTCSTLEESFVADEQQQDAVVRNIEIIGEASRNIQTEVSYKFSLDSTGAAILNRTPLILFIWPSK